MSSSVRLLNVLVVVSLLLGTAPAIVPVAAQEGQPPVADETPTATTTPTSEAPAETPAVPTTSPTPEAPATETPTPEPPTIPEPSAQETPTAIPAPDAVLSPTFDSLLVTPEPPAMVGGVELGTLPPRGGELAAPDGRVRLAASSGAVAHATAVRLQVSQTARLARGQMGAALHFRLEPDVQFAEPVTLTVNLSGLVSLRDLPPGWHPYLACREDPSDDWHYVPLQSVNWETGEITAQVEHFSEWEGGVVSENGWLLSFNDAHVEGFRGSVSYQIPLEVPAGRGGLQPQLTLDYNSDRINGILARVQSDWVGLGWSLDAPQIVRNVNWCPWGGGQLCIDTQTPDYTLVLGGAGYSLLPDVSNTCIDEACPSKGAGRYRTDEESFLYVEKVLTTTQVNELGTYWVVTGKDGTRYTFGATPDSEQVLFGLALPDLHTVYRWRLNRVVDVWGNEAIYEYYDDEPGDYYERASYLAAIRYNRKADGTWGTEIFFDRHTRLGEPDGTIPPGALFFQQQHLDKVRVVQNGQTVREYRLAYDFNGESRRLQALTEYGNTGGALPATTFEYQVSDNTRADWGNGQTYPYSRLSAINNGYGGRIEVVYQQTEVNQLHGYHYRVQRRSTLDGMGHTARREYLYGPACMDATDSKCDDGNRDWGLKGYEWSTEQAYDYDARLLNVVTSTYVLPWPLTGRVGVLETAGADGRVLQRSETTWAARLSGAGGDANDWTEASLHFRSSDRAHSGNTSIKSVYTNPACVAGVATWSDPISVQPNTNYVLSGWVYRDATTGAARLDISPVWFSVNSTTAVGDWQYIAGTWNSGGNTSVQVRLVTDCNVNGPVWFDDISLAVAGSANLVVNPSFESGVGDRDVTLPQVMDVTATDTSGGQAASTRTAYTYDNYGNVTSEYNYGAEARVVNAGFEAPIIPFSGWQEPLTNWTAFWNPSPATTTTGTAFAGRSSLQLSGVITGGACQDVTGLVPGEVYTLRAWARATPGTTARLVLWVGGLAWVVYEGSSLSTTAWTPVSATFTATNSSQVRLHFKYEIAGGRSGTIYVDEVSLARAQDVGDERSIHRFYFNLTDGGRWLIGLKWGENVFEGIRPNADVPELKTQTIWYYDDYTYDPARWGQSAQIARGQVTMVGQGLWNKPNQPFITTTTAYDQWGNTTVVTDALGHATTTAYDGLYHLYPVQTCSPLVGSPAQPLCSSTEYYGIGVPADYGLPGQVRRVTDPNGATTEYRYDSFGRLIKVIRPGDTVEAPTIAYDYFDAPGMPPFTSPLLIETRYANLVQENVRQFYDGLGRLIQTQQRRSEIAGQSERRDVLVSTVYDALGRQVRQTAPYDTPAYPGYGGTPYQSYTPGLRPETLTAYDALGRAVRVVNPDGTAASTIYGARTATQVDANGHFRFSDQDGLGRMASVWEAQETWRDNFDTLDTSRWVFTTQTLDGGAVRTTGMGSDWNATFYRNEQTITSMEGIRVDFVLGSTDTKSILALDTVPYYPDASYRRWGIQADSGLLQAQFCEGTSCSYPTLGSVRPNVWYVLWLQVNDAGEYRIQMWERDNPAASFSYARRTPNFSGGKAWRFRHWIRSGTSWIDNYAEIDHYQTRYGYDTLDNLTTVTDTLSNTTVITYNALGLKTAMRDPDMGYWQYTYDAAGNLQTQTDARGCVITFGYDPLNRLTGKSYGGTCGGGLVTYAYDQGLYGVGRRTAMTDTSGSAIWRYDVRGRMITETKSINGGGTFATQYTYDTLDRVTAMTYPDGEVVTQTYNAQGLPVQLRSVTYALNYANGVAYNALGQLTALPLGNTLTTNYTYDPLTFRLGRIQTGNLLDLNYGYDPVGNVQSILDAPTVTFADTFGTLSQWTVVSGTWAVESGELSQNNDSSGDFTRLSIRANAATFADATVMVDLKSDRSYAIDNVVLRAANANLNANNQFWVRIDHRNVWSQGLRLIEDVNGSEVERCSASFDVQEGQWYRLMIVLKGTNVKVYLGGVLRLDCTVSKTSAGYFGLQAETNHAHFDNVRVMTGVSANFTYDALDRLTGASGQYTQTYAYNPIGNITYTTNLGTYSYGDPLHKHAVTAISNGSQYAYDANGNMILRVEMSNTQRITYTQGWDAENRLSVVTNTVSGQVTRFTYDGDGNRVKATTGVTTTVYVGVHYEVQGTTITKYYYLGGTRVAMRVGLPGQASALYYLHADHLGSASLTTCGTSTGCNGITYGAIVAQQRYYPYGMVRWSSGTMPTDRTFTGQQNNYYINLYLMGARWYDGQIGRWISPDTIVPDPANPQSFNRFSYVLGNPLKYTDPSGHIEEGEYSDATDIVNRLCQDYGVCVSVDFGYEIEPNTGLVLGFLKGLWKMDELRILEEVVLRFEDEAGSAEAVKQAIGGVSILRISKGDTAYWSPFGIITIADHTFSQTGFRSYWGPRVAIAHELAHYWDFKASSWRQRVSDVGELSSRMHNAVRGEEGPTWCGRTNAFEEWAESTTGYLYPEYFAVLRAEGKGWENYTVNHWLGFEQRLPGLGPFHEAFVARQFQALRLEVHK